MLQTNQVRVKCMVLYGLYLFEKRGKLSCAHDCDITTYNRDLLARLVYPVSNPNFNYEFCKGYYPRIREGALSGRVTRLLVTPLLKTFKKSLVTEIILSLLMYLGTR